MRIGSKIFIVGAIPIVIAAGIALAALLLLQEANRARSGAALAGTVFRTILTAVMARNDYLHEAPGSRFVHARRFFEVTTQAADDLGKLRDIAPGESSATRDAEKTLSQYVNDMKKLVGVTAANDKMIETMRDRAASLIGLTDQARERQHASNADIVNSLTEGDRKLRAARNIMDAAYSARLAVASIEADILRLQTAQDPQAQDPQAQDNGRRSLVFDANRLRQVAATLTAQLQAKAEFQIDAVPSLAPEALSQIERFTTAFSSAGIGLGPDDLRIISDLAQWTEQLVKIYSAEYRSFHEQAAQLLTYSVQAHDTELATQNIAIEALKLGNQAAAALTRRDETASQAILANSRSLTDTMANLPISPLIQSEMIDAFTKWHDGLQAATEATKQQNDLMDDMDDASADMIKAARSLDATFSSNAEYTGRSIQAILILGAATGLLLGGGAAYFVARSITKPLGQLQARITHMAQDHGASRDLMEDRGRGDEFGDIARAANVFLIEIAHRESALRKAKERADAALDTLRRTQVELIQAEKLASLGQLVAGVAHEINTPIGIALTTSTVVDEEARRFRALAQEQRISRNALDRFVERVSEGAALLTTNLTRAADLIQSFKHVAADQVSGERREFDVRIFLQQLLTSLGPMLRKAGHTTTMQCPPDLFLDSYPGALAQVITNLIVNASLHAFKEGARGTITVSASPATLNRVRFVVSDDGSGIAPEHRGKVFDPFFTTNRAQGSTGLGLHIVFNLVTSTLHGRIDLDSAPGSGTRITVDLPTTPPAPRKMQPNAKALS